MKLLFVEASMVSQCDSIADSQSESKTVTTMLGSHSENSGTQQFLKDTMESSDSEYENKISNVTCDCVAVAVVAGSTSVLCDDKFEEDGKATGESEDCFISPFARNQSSQNLILLKNVLFNHS